MMHRAGLVSPEEADRVLAHARARGVSPAAAFVELGFATEQDLVRFVQSKLMIPRVDPELLERVPPEAHTKVGRDIAWTYEVLPVSVDDVGNLTLAMADPTDLRGVDAVVEATSAYVIRAVAPRGALREAIERLYGPESEASPPPRKRRSAPDLDAAPPLPPVRAVDETIPPLSATAFGQVLPKLVTARDRDEITQVLVDFLADGFQRVIMFVNVQGQLRGREARGADLDPEAVRQVRIPTSGESIFKRVIESQAPYFGPWPTETRIDRAFDGAMGGLRGNVLVLPVALRGRVPVIVMAAGTPHPVDPRSLAELVEAVSLALERLIFRQKSQDNLPRVE